jgi:electron transport complex protein RnfB
MEKNENKRSPIERRKFLQMLGSAVAGGTILATTGIFARNVGGREASHYWQIDPSKCTFCGLCATHCVLSMSAVKCIHAKKICGYCDLCGGYFRSFRELNTAAENVMCPLGAIERKFIEDPYFEYNVNEDLCNGCGKCCKGCNAFGNGSLYLQIKRDLCKDCNECKIATVCPADAIVRQPLTMPYNLKDKDR